MNKNLLRIGGAINLLFVVFHLALVKPIGAVLTPLSPDIAATVATWDIQLAFIVLIFAYFAILRWRDLLTTRIGNLLAIAIASFWFLRAAAQVAFYGMSAADLPLIVLGVVLGLLHLIPVLREWRNVPPEGQHPAERPVEATSQPHERIERTPWTSYAVVAWCVVFGGLHLYWALGGNAGFVEFSTPTAKPLALVRDPIYMAITWGVVLVCAYGAVIALAPFQAWSRRIARWFVIAPLWIACGISLVRGIGNPIQSALVVGGAWSFDPLPAAEMRDWYQWLLIDAILYSPWFILGGLAFGATARTASRYMGGMRGGALASAAQG